MVACAEALQMLLSEVVAVSRERLENQRMHNVESGNMQCTILNAMVAAQQEQNVILREGMATHAKLLRTCISTDKQKVSLFT